MTGTVRIWSLCLAGLMAAGSANALTVTTANLGSGRGCVDAACTDQRLILDSSATGSGSLTIGGGLMSFSITLPSSIFLPISGPNDNGVTSLEFDTVTYSGTATISQVGMVVSILGGSATVSGTQTPTGAGVGGLFSATDSLLAGTCTDLVSVVVCGIIFNSPNDFNFDVNGQTRHFSHTMNLTAIPEPATALLVGLGIVGLAAVRRRI